MALNNDFVKKYLFDNLEKLLRVETCGGDQAQAIAEVLAWHVRGPGQVKTPNLSTVPVYKTHQTFNDSTSGL